MTPERIAEIRNLLADAFGGHSQFRGKDLGKALAGHLINNYTDAVDPRPVAQEAARQEAERWEMNSRLEAEVEDEILTELLKRYGSAEKWSADHQQFMSIREIFGF